ncbi:MAG TPA: hypothetical protein VGK73_10630 [Polyangiaceae bacterium]
MSYDLVVACAAPPSWQALRALIALDDLRVLPDEPAGADWPEGELRLCRVGRSTRETGVGWKDGKLTIVVRALASPDDCDLALRVAAAAARLTGAATIEADYFGPIPPGELRNLHTADWMREQALSGTRVLATLIGEGRSPMGTPGPKRTCYFGTRTLAELEAAGPPEALPDRVLATLRRVQWDVPADFRDAGVFESGGDGDARARKTRFAVWLSDENLVLPWVDYVALRVKDGEIVMVPFDAVAGLAGSHGTLLDECQLLVRAFSDEEWKAVVARARSIAKGQRK